MIPQRDGRYLIVWTRASERKIAVALRVVRGYELACYLNSGWALVAEDPEPDRPWFQKADDDSA